MSKSKYALDRKWVTHCCLFLFISARMYGGVPALDSLYRVLKTSIPDTEKVNTLNVLSRQLFLSSKFDTSYATAKIASDIADKIGFKVGFAFALNNIGNVELNTGHPDDAMKHYQQALDIQMQLPQTGQVKKGLAGSYSNIGNIYNARGKYDEALKYYQLALRIRTGINDLQGIAICYNNIATIYFLQGIYPEALKNNLAALRIEEQINDKIGIARTYNNTGNIYIQQANYPEAISNYTKAIVIQQSIGDRQGVSRASNNLGAIFLLQKDYTNAMLYFRKALAVKKELSDKKGVGYALINLADAQYGLAFLPGVSEKERETRLDSCEKYFADALKILQEINDVAGISQVYNNTGALLVTRHHVAEGEDLLHKGLELALKVHNKEEIRSSYKGLAAADSAKGDWHSAMDNYKIYILYRDSLINEENTKKIVQAQMNYDFSQKEEKMKNEQARRDLAYSESLARQRIITWSSVSVIALVLFAALLLVNRYRLKQKNQLQEQLNRQQKEQAIAIMETQEQERKRIAEDIHDSLGHLLSTAKLNLQALPADQQKNYVPVVNLLDQASVEIRNISFNLMPKALEEEGLVPALYELADKIRQSKLFDVMIQVHDMENFQLDKQTRYNIYRIVQEAVNNILKHANAHEITIQLIRHGEVLSIMIEDDGKGFDKQLLKQAGRGLRNITARSEWLHGNITIDSSPGRGTTIAIEIPVKQKI